jgi:hypothetical protein
VTDDARVAQLAQEAQRAGPTGTLLRQLQARLGIAGQVDSDGTILAGVGFTVAHPSTGVYVLSYDLPTVPAVGVLPQAAGTSLSVVQRTLATATSVELDIFVSNTGAAVNARFSFTARPCG